MWVVMTFVLLITAILFVVAMSPPRALKSSQVYRGHPFEYVVRGWSRFNWIFVAVPCACQCALLIMDATTSTLRDAALPYVCPYPPSTISALTLLTPRFALGSLALLVGGAIRLWCFHELGELFTYEVVVQENHTLITTGPYAFVRHPSYTGRMVMMVSAQTMLFGGELYDGVRTGADTDEDIRMGLGGWPGVSAYFAA